MRAGALAAAAAISAALATLASLSPVRMYLGKLDSEIIGMTNDVFVHMTLPRLAVGLAAIFGGIYLREGHPRLGWALVFAAPVLVIVAHLLLLAFNL